MESTIDSFGLTLMIRMLSCGLRGQLWDMTQEWAGHLYIFNAGSAKLFVF